jgi:uncharacterized protein
MIHMPYRALLLAAAVFVLLFSLPSARAQTTPDAARLAAAKEMMAVAGVAKQFEEVMPLLLQQLAQGFVAVAPDKAQEIREVFSQLGSKFNDRKGELIDQVATLYAEQLSVEELTAVAGFYRSPAGVKMIAIQPHVMRQAMLLGQRWGAELGREIEEEARRELKKRGIQL